MSSPKVHATIDDVSCIWNASPHNAFTDLIAWKERLFCAFRVGRNHVSTDGRIQILISEDGDRWMPAAIVEKAGFDLRDADLSEMPDGRLLLVGGVARRLADNVKAETNTFFSISEDGENWSEPVVITDGGRWIWRATWCEDHIYGVSYGEHKGIDFFSGQGPDEWTLSSEQILVEGRPSEVKVFFDSDQMAHALVRRDEPPYSALLGSASAPYDEWTWQDLGMDYPSFGGPNVAHTPWGWVAGGRMFDGGVDFDGAPDHVYTALNHLDLETATMSPLLRLPSGGDNSYPGLVWDDEREILWMSYYSSHEGQTSIYRARIRLSDSISA